MITSFTQPYLDHIERNLIDAIETMGDPSPLRDACAYALQGGGKRLRPILVCMIAQALGRGRDVMRAALGVEFFHTASLIADDLPCMDNDDMRRDRPSLHKVFGESTALLASYTLISAGYAAICDASRRLKEQLPDRVAHIDAITLRCLETVTGCAGLNGATHGQFLDLFPPDQSLDTILTIIHRKTATLFEASFILGWLFGGGSEGDLEEVRACARHLGAAFQIADDCEDFKQDVEHATGLNMARVLGWKKTRSIFEQEMDGFCRSLQSLGLWTEPFQRLSDDLYDALSKAPIGP
jgi:geranylgeranyl diphosphate synthase type II